MTLTGGLWRAGAAVIAPFRGWLADLLPGAHIILPELPPIYGACVLALQQGGVIVNASVLQPMHNKRGLV